MDRGTYIDYQGRPAVRFRRAYEQPIDRLWKALTEPDELSHWFPSSVRLTPQAGGTIEFFDDPNTEPRSGTILVFEPPRRLAYTWGGEELHFELDPTGEHGCVLTLIDVLEDRAAAARNAAGWSVCLEELDKLARGEATAGPHAGPTRRWQRYYDEYVSDGMPAGAPIPGR